MALGNTQQMSGIAALSQNMPIANRRLAAQKKAAQELQLQQAVKAAPAAAPAPQQAQAAGQAVAQNQGAAMVQAAQQNLAGQGQVAGVAQQAQATDIKGQLNALQNKAQQEQIGAAERLGKLSADAKKEVLDSRLQFQKDEMGRTFLNDRQLADWAKLNTKSEQDFQNYAQTAKQVSDRNIYALESAYKKLEQQLQFEQARGGQIQDQKLTMELAQAKSELEKKIQTARAAAANRAQIFGTVGMIAGAVGGAFIGGPAGAAAGASVGSGLGTMAASSTQEEEQY